MSQRKVFITDELIKEKAHRIQILLNQQIPEENQLHLKFSNEWLQNLKRHNFKSPKSHGESKNIDEILISIELPKLQKNSKTIA